MTQHENRWTYCTQCFMIPYPREVQGKCMKDINQFPDYVSSTPLQSLPRYQFPMSVNRKSLFPINSNRNLFVPWRKLLFLLVQYSDFFDVSDFLWVNKKSTRLRNNGSLPHKAKKLLFSLALFFSPASKKFNRKLGWKLLFGSFASLSIISFFLPTIEV